MDIRDWPINRIMQLPDCCFGRRWPVGMSKLLVQAGAFFDITKAPLPDRFCVWGVNAIGKYTSGSDVQITLAMGDELPATDALFNDMPLLFPEIESLNGTRGAFDTCYISQRMIENIKVPVMGTGRRIVARFLRETASSLGVSCSVIISSIPNEVPDWLLKQ